MAGGLVLVALVCLGGDCQRIERPVSTTCQQEVSALKAALLPTDKVMIPVCVDASSIPQRKERARVALAR